jgi:hypothetical protein
MTAPSRHGLLAGAAAGPATGPDIDLLALCSQHMRSDQNQTRLQGLFWEAEDAGDKQAQDHFFELMRREVPAMRQRLARIAELPSRTPAGARAKAEVLRTRTLFHSDGSPFADHALAHSVAQDVLTLTGDAA